MCKRSKSSARRLWKLLRLVRLRFLASKPGAHLTLIGHAAERLQQGRSEPSAEVAENLLVDQGRRAWIGRKFSPLVILFLPFHRARTFRFWLRFKDRKAVEEHALAVTQVLASSMKYPLEGSDCTCAISGVNSEYDALWSEQPAIQSEIRGSVVPDADIMVSAGLCPASSLQRRRLGYMYCLRGRAFRGSQSHRQPATGEVHSGVHLFAQAGIRHSAFRGIRAQRSSASRCVALFRRSIRRF